MLVNHYCCLNYSITLLGLTLIKPLFCQVFGPKCQPSPFENYQSNVLNLLVFFLLIS